MSDLEAAHRQEVCKLMSSACECVEHAAVRRANGARGQIDVLLLPKDHRLSALTLAIEVKIHAVIGDRELGPWIKQAADYIGARPDNAWPPVVAAFVWLIGVELNRQEDEQCRMAGMLQLAQHFRVGSARETQHGLTLVFGPTGEIYREKRGGWTSKAVNLLSARRISAGTRKGLINDDFK